MRIWLDKTVDEEFEDLGTQGHTGTLNDRQFTFLATLSHTGSLADRMASFIAGGRVVDTTAPVVTSSSYDSGTTTVSLNIVEASGTATCYWALVANPSTPTEAQVVAGTGGGILESGSFTVTSGGDTDLIDVTDVTGNEIHIVIKDAAGNSTGTPSGANNTVITGVTVGYAYNVSSVVDQSALTSVTLSLPTYSSGDLLVAFVSVNQDGGFPGASRFSSTPSGWTYFDTMAGWSGGNSDLQIWTKTASASESAPTWDCTGVGTATALDGGLIIGFPGMSGVSGFSYSKSFSSGTLATPAHSALGTGDYAVYAVCRWDCSSPDITEDTTADVIVNNAKMNTASPTIGSILMVEVDFDQTDAGAARTFGNVKGRAVFQVDA